jgi:methanethiol S-methyltransferase
MGGFADSRMGDQTLPTHGRAEHSPLHHDASSPPNPLEASLPLGTDTFVVRSGRIAAQTFTTVAPPVDQACGTKRHSQQAGVGTHRRVVILSPYLEIAMRGLFSFLYGVAAYAACLLVLLYLIGFSGNLFVPKSVDIGAGAPWAQALGVDVLLLVLFGVQHSVMARRGFKRWWTHVVPPAVERSTYVVATCTVLALMFWFWLPIQAPVVWQVENSVGAALLWGLFGVGWLLVLISTFLINHFELFGLQQVFARLRRRVVPEVQFKTPLLYRYVRHPLYLGLLLSLWMVPRMTAGRLLFAVGFSAYIGVGIAFEERDLIAQFGDRYRRYRAEVGMLLPWRSRS